MTAVSRWDLPTVSGTPVQARRAGKTVAEIEEVERQAYEEAYAKGRAEGHAQGLAEGRAAAKAEQQPVLAQLQAQVERLEQMLNALAEPLKDVDAQVESELTNLALTVARQLVRRELRIDPAQVIAIIRETIALLPSAARDVRVHLHPEDAAVVRERLAATTTERAWTIVEDPVMTRGGCRVTSENSHIDARLDTRIHTVISSILGDERATSRGEQAPSA